MIIGCPRTSICCQTKSCSAAPADPAENVTSNGPSVPAVNASSSERRVSVVSVRPLSWRTTWPTGIFSQRAFDVLQRCAARCLRPECFRHQGATAAPACLPKSAFGRAAKRLEVHIRTVRRYVAMLEELGIPVAAERGRYGAYRLMPGFKLPPLMFTEEEALATLLGLLAARQLGLTATAAGVEGAIAKLERVLPLPLREKVRAVEETLVLDLRVGRSEPVSGVVVALSAAASRRSAENNLPCSAFYRQPEPRSDRDLADYRWRRQFRS